MLKCFKSINKSSTCQPFFFGWQNYQNGLPHGLQCPGGVIPRETDGLSGTPAEICLERSRSKPALGIEHGSKCQDCVTPKESGRSHSKVSIAMATWENALWQSSASVDKRVTLWFAHTDQNITLLLLPEKISPPTLRVALPIVACIFQTRVSNNLCLHSPPSTLKTYQISLQSKTSQESISQKKEYY